MKTSASAGNLHRSGRFAIGASRHVGAIMIEKFKSLVRAGTRRASRALAQEVFLRRRRGDSFDILDTAFLRAAVESSQFYERHMLQARPFPDDLSLLTYALSKAAPDGLILEFGVASGRTIRHLASLTPRPIAGFDSFQGLPETWYTGFEKGSFAQPPPAVPSNVSLHAGWFTETLPPFIDRSIDPVSLLHIDCDLYSSTAFVLTALTTHVRPGTVIVFDEYFNYPGWKGHEHKAFLEFVNRTGLQFRYDAFVPSHQQVCVVIEDASASR